MKKNLKKKLEKPSGQLGRSSGKGCFSLRGDAKGFWPKTKMKKNLREKRRKK